MPVNGRESADAGWAAMRADPGMVGGAHGTRISTLAVTNRILLRRKTH
jgi:hypothetical protein